ncbi:YfhO family protein [Patescibacteria group bacterium]|nr:YfhO family protein [Patescibacteria group bacterium]
MNKPLLSFLIPLVFAVSIVSLFCYKTVLRQEVPFPGDLLVAEYNPWKTYSFLGYAPGSYPNKAQFFDTLRQLYPWRTLATELAKRGTLPLWNPHNFAGSPLLANFQSAVLYPLNMLYLALPRVPAWTILTLLQPFLALLFTYLFLKKLGVSSVPAWFGAVAYAFSSFMTVWIEYNTIGQVILWLPLILLSIEHLRGLFSATWYVTGIIALVMAALAGHPQVFGYLWVFALLYMLFRFPGKNYPAGIAMFALPIAIAGAQLVPGAELTLLAARSSHTASEFLDKILIQPWQLLMVLVPDFFGSPATRSYWPADTYVGKVTSVGLAALLFALGYIATKRDSLTKFFLSAIGVVILLVTANPVTAVIYRYPVPFISTSSPTLMVFIAEFSLAVLAARGMDAFRRHVWNIRAFTLVMAPVAAVLVLLWAGVLLAGHLPVSWAAHLPASRRVLFLASGISVVSALLFLTARTKQKLMTLILILFFFLEVADLWQAFRKFTPFVPTTLVYPPTSVTFYLGEHAGINRYWALGAASIEANFATLLGLYAPEGYDPLYPKIYAQFIGASRTGTLPLSFTDKTRSDAVIAPSDGSDLLTNPFRRRVLDVLGVRYILDVPANHNTESTLPPDVFPKLADVNGWTVLENTSALPRMFLAGDAIAARAPEQFAREFFSPSFDPGKTVVLDRPLPMPLSNAATGSVHLRSYTADSVEAETQSSGTKLLFLSDTYYPGWKAYVDGRPAELYRADYAFRAVPVPGGKHTVVMRYEPASLWIGIAISLLGILGTIASIALFQRKTA